MTTRGRQGLDLVLLSEWEDDGAASDVTGLTVTITPAGGGSPVVGPTATGIIHLGLGQYTYDWAVPDDQDPGLYVWTWTADEFGAGPGVQIQSAMVEVVTTYGDAYVDVEQVREAMKLGNDHSKDNQIALNAVASSRAVDDRCGRVFYKTAQPETRTVYADGRLLQTANGLWLMVPDIASTTGLSVGGFSGTVVAGPPSDLARGWPITELRGPRWTRSGEYDIEAIWGWPAIPATIEEATLLQTMRLTRRPGSPEGVAGSAEWGLVRIPNLDPDVRALLEPYRLPGIA